jgi:hypothetical protein
MIRDDKNGKNVIRLAHAIEREFFDKFSKSVRLIQYSSVGRSPPESEFRN